MSMEVKVSAPSTAHQAASSFPLDPPTPIPQHHAHSAVWQAGMDAAFAAFLKGVNEQLSQTGQLKLRPIMLSYARQPHEESFIACTLIASSAQNREKISKLLEDSVKKNGGLVFEFLGSGWVIHYCDQGRVQSIVLRDLAQDAQLNAIAASSDLTKGLAITEPAHLQTIIQIAESVSPEAVTAVQKLNLSQPAEQLLSYLLAAGLQVIVNPIDVNAPQAGIDALKSQLEQNSDTQLILLTTPAYRALANQQNKLLHQILVEFGAGKKDNLLPLMCLGGFGIAAGILPNNFMFRDYQSSLRVFDGPQGGMPVFLDVFGELSGRGGLGLLPDLLDLEGTNSDHQSTYAALFTTLSQTQARLTTDYALEKELNAQFTQHPLHKYYAEAQGLHVASAAEEKQSDIPTVLSGFLSDPRVKTALLLSSTAADTELSGLAVVEMLRQQATHPRVITIDLRFYPGRAAHQCLALTLRHTLKLSTPIIQQLQQHALGERTARPTVLVLKNYQHTGSYDNLYIKNALANWPDLKVIVTCTADYFNRHDPKVCFLSDPTNPDASSLQQVMLSSFASQLAQATAICLMPESLENLKALLAENNLTPKRQAQQHELDRFLDRIAPLATALPANARNAFISYAWELPATRTRQQRHLRQIAQDLGRAGFPTWLDIERMTGDINAQMAQNIRNSHYALIIGTPRYTQRATVLQNNGQPTNVKREYDDILLGHQEQRLEVLALSFLPTGPFDDEKSEHYSTFPDTLPADIPHFNLFEMDDFENYIERLTDEREGLLPRLLHLSERTPDEQQTYQTARAALMDALALLPAQHLIIAQAEQDQRIYEVPQRRSLYIEARGKAEYKNESVEFGLTAQFDLFLSAIASPTLREETPEVEDTVRDEEKHEDGGAVAESKDNPRDAGENKAEPKEKMIPPSQATTFVALGEGGSGKSLFSQIQYARLLEQWQAHKKDPATHPRPAWIAVYIPLKQYVGKYEDNAENQAAKRVGQVRVDTCVETALREVYQFDEHDIAVLKTGSGQMQKLGVLLILDGYDELAGETPHLYRLNKLDQWTCPLKLLVTSRMDYIPDPDKHKSYFETLACSFVCSYIQSFSAEDVQRYIQLYETQTLIQQSQAQAARDIAAGVLTPTAQPPYSDTYQTLEALPGLLELVKNPFLLNLVLQGLPYLLAARTAKDNHPVTPLEIYDSFGQYWFGKEVYRLVRRDDSELRLRLEQHAERLAFQLYLNQQLSVSQKSSEDKHLWDAFFDTSVQQIAQARVALPLRDVGNQRYEFIHKTLFEYFVTSHLVNAYRRPIPGQPHPNPIALGEELAKRPPGQKVKLAAGVPLPMQDVGVFSFLNDAVRANDGECSFKTALFEQIKYSATPEGKLEPLTGGRLGLAAAHAVTILTKTGISMANQAWSGIQLPGADLSLAILVDTDLSGANLQGAYLSGAFLNGADLRRANLEAVRFMEYPTIKLGNGILCLALYPSQTAGQDRPWIAVGQNKKVVILDYETKQIIWQGKGHTEKVTCLTFNPSGNQLLSGSYDGTLRLWQLGKGVSGELISQAVLRGHKKGVLACAFSPHGDQVVSGSADTTLRLWHVEQEARGEIRPQAVLPGHKEAVITCAFSPLGDLIVSGSADDTLRLWPVDRVNEELIFSQTILKDQGGRFAFSPLGDRMVSGSGNQLLLWKMAKERCGEPSLQAILRGHENHVTACAFNMAGNQVVSTGSLDKTIRLWEVGKEITGEHTSQRVLRGHDDYVTACAFNLAGDLVVSGSIDGALRLWQVERKASRALTSEITLSGHERNITTCAFSPKGDLVVSIGELESKLHLWQVVRQKRNTELVLQTVNVDWRRCVTACAFSPSGDWVISGHSWNSALQLWRRGKTVSSQLFPQAVLGRRAEEMDGEVTLCAFSPTIDLVASSNSETLSLWQVKKGVSGDVFPLTTLRGHKSQVNVFIFSPTGDQILSASRDSTLRLWHVGKAGSGEIFLQAVLRGHKGSVTVCAFSPDGNLAVSGGTGKKLCLWQVGKTVCGDISPLAVLRGHKGQVNICMFNPAGDQILSASHDATVRLWHIDKGTNKKISSRVMLRGVIATACAFSPTGDLVVAGSDTQGNVTLQLWDIGNIHNLHSMRVLKRWCAYVRSLDIYPKNFLQYAATSLDQTNSSSIRPTLDLPSIHLVVGDDAGLVSLWQLEGGDLRFIGMPPQRGMTKIWRNTWRTAKLMGVQAAGLTRTLLEQYRGAPLQEGDEENQVRLIADVANEAQGEIAEESKYEPAPTRAPQGKTGFFSRLTRKSTAQKPQVSAVSSSETTISVSSASSPRLFPQPQRVPAKQGVQQAQQRLGQTVLALLAAIEAQRQPDWDRETHIDFTAAVVDAFLQDESGKDFAQLCQPPRCIPMPVSLRQFIETYISEHHELRELNTDIAFAVDLKSKLSFNLDALYERFGVLAPVRAEATHDGGNAFV